MALLPTSPPLLSSSIPSQPLRNNANEEGRNHAAHRKDGHGESPECSKGALWDGIGSLRTLPPQPCRIVALFNHLGDDMGVNLETSFCHLWVLTPTAVPSLTFCGALMTPML